MNAKIKNARHVEAAGYTPLHLTLKSRATAMLTAGCLALSLCPTVALAAPMADQAGPMGDQANQPTMQMPADNQEALGDEQQMQGAPQFQQNGQWGFGGQQGADQDAMQGEQPADANAMQGPAANVQAPTDAPAFDEGQAPEGMPAFDEGQAPEGAPSWNDEQTPTEAEASGDQAPAGAMQGSTDAPQPSANNNQALEGAGPESADGTAGELPAMGNENAPMGDRGQAPTDGQQPPAFENGPRGGMAGDDVFAGEIRDILMDGYGVTAPSDADAPAAPSSGEEGAMPQGGPAGNPGDFAQGAPMVGEAPELPEGAVNVQAVIDSARDAVQEYGADTLKSADFTDGDFLSGLIDYVKTATEQREAAFAEGAAPSFGAPANNGEAPSDEALSSEAPEAGDQAQQAPDAAPQSLGSSVLKNLIDAIANALGFNAQ